MSQEPPESRAPTSPRGLVPLLIALTALACAAPVRSIVEAGDAPTERALDGVLAVVPGAEVVVLGRARVLRPATKPGGLALIRVETEKVLRGEAESQFTLFASGAANSVERAWFAEWSPDGKNWFSSGSNDAAPSTLFSTEGSGRYALFLSPTPNGSGLALDAHFSIEGAEGAEKALVLEKELASEVAAVADADSKARVARRLAFLLDLLASPRPWSRTHAARGLEALAKVAPSWFTPAARREIEAVARRTLDAPTKAKLARVLAATASTAATAEPPDGDVMPAASPRAGSTFAPTAPAAGDCPPPGSAAPAHPAAPAPSSALSPDYHRALRRFADEKDVEARLGCLSELARTGRAAAASDLLAAARSSTDAALRERAIVLLGDVGARSTRDAVVALYDRETEPAVREAIVRAVGLLGDASDIDWLVGQASDPALHRPVAFALARVRTDAALGVLREIGRRARAATPPDDDLAKVVEYLQTPAFVEAERMAGRTVGPRSPVPKVIPAAPPAPSGPAGAAPDPAGRDAK